MAELEQKVSHKEYLQTHQGMPEQQTVLQGQQAV